MILISRAWLYSQMALAWPIHQIQIILLGAYEREKIVYVKNRVCWYSVLSLTVGNIPPSLPSLFFSFSYKNDRDTAVSWRFHFFSLSLSPSFSPLHCGLPFLFLASPGAVGYYIRQQEDFFDTVHRQAPINVAFPGVAFIPTWGFIQTCWLMLQTANTTTTHSTQLRNL